MSGAPHRRVRVPLDEGATLAAWVRDAPPPAAAERVRQEELTSRLVSEHAAGSATSEPRLVSSILVGSRRYDTWWAHELPRASGALAAGPAVTLQAFLLHVSTLRSRYSSTYLGPPFPAIGAEQLPPREAAERLAVVDSLAHDGREQELSPYRRRAAADPGRAQAHYELGLIIWYQHFTGAPGAVDEAEAPLRRALALAPHAHAAHGLLGEILLRAGRPGDAASAFAEAARLRVHHPRYHYGLSVASEAAGDEAGARRALLRAKQVAGPKLRRRFTPGSNPLTDYRTALLGEALRVRTKREGLATASERELAEEQRARNAIDRSEVPEELHGVVPLVERWGLGDGPSRDYFVERATRTERQELRRAVERHAARIRAWLDSLAPGREPAAYTRFLHFLDAVDELGIRPRD